MDGSVGTRVRLQPLTYVDEGDGVMVGRPDTGSYGLFPREGAELLRCLEAGETLESGARGWHERTGEQLDVEDFLGILDDLGFVVGEGEERAAPPAVRWRWLGRALFSPPAFAMYAVVVAAGVAAMVLDPGLRPGYERIFFTSNLSFIPIVLALSQFPLLLLHEGFHALAARRLGLPSTLGVGRRFYYLVAETRMDSLYSVPRARRYLPLLAGALVDAVGVGAFTLLAAAGRQWGWPPWLTGLLLALAFSGVLRILWECLFYLETDFYFVINTATGCTDLHGAARQRVKGLLAAVLRRPARQSDEEWSERDRAAARWYAPLMVAGYGLSLGTLLAVGVPAAVRFWTTVAHRFDRTPTVWEAVDTAVFVLLALAELGLLAYVTIRDLRRRRIERNSS
ncbi:hypothetical protein [Nonomuraea sp. NPDC005650]|uniref:hypothetical protein n=1 Tax=Nonomuraea sp. NPDC005650 TaxID=3157045 RepID=UPI0033B3C12C